jgi:arginyl-tRNA synthetase
MSTIGRVIVLDEVLDEAKSKALTLCTEKNPDLKDKDNVAEMVGIGAVVFGELSSHRTRDIEFNWEQVLALEGETGPYVQYSLVRCHSLLERAGNPKFLLKDFSNYEFAPEEEFLLLTIARFSSALEQVVRENDPFYLTRYLIEVAKSFNRFYYKLPVLQASEENQKELRLHLVEGTRQILSTGLQLLGIRCPQEM